jgi:hypothetical protein
VSPRNPASTTGPTSWKVSSGLSRRLGWRSAGGVTSWWAGTTGPLIGPVDILRSRNPDLQ